MILYIRYILCFLAMCNDVASEQPLEHVDWMQVLGDLKNVQTELCHLKDDMKNIQRENGEIKIENQNLKKENMELKLKMDDLKIETQRTLNEIKQTCQTKNDVSRVKNKRQINEPVAFTAVLDRHVTLGPHQTLIFDTVITNIGKAYEVRDGQFTAPIFGLYVMSVTICSGSNSAVHVELVKNGVQMGAIYGDDFDLGSQTLIMELNENDRVWVRHFIDAGNGLINNEKDRHYTTFSGALLVAL